MTITDQMSLRDISMGHDPVLLGEQLSLGPPSPPHLLTQTHPGEHMELHYVRFSTSKIFASHYNKHRESESSDSKGYLNKNVSFHSPVNGHLDCFQCFTLDTML